MSRSLLLPEFFVDRSLGRHQVSATLRAAGWRLQTHYEVYGARDENVSDVEWLEYCGSRLVVLSKGQRLRYNPPEIGRTFGVKVFVLASGNLTGTAQAERSSSRVPVSAWLRRLRGRWSTPCGRQGSNSSPTESNRHLASVRARYAPGARPPILRNE